MSLLKKYLKGWTFRTTVPALEPGETVAVFVSGYDEATGEGIARVGDTRLLVEGFDPDYIDHRVSVRIDEYDPDEGVGRGEFLTVVGESSYSG